MPLCGHLDHPRVEMGVIFNNLCSSDSKYHFVTFINEQFLYMEHTFHAICKFTQSANCAMQSEDLQIGGQSADCASTQLFGVHVNVITSFDSNSGLDRCMHIHVELKVVT